MQKFGSTDFLQLLAAIHQRQQNLTAFSSDYWLSSTINRFWQHLAGFNRTFSASLAMKRRRVDHWKWNDAHRKCDDSYRKCNDAHRKCNAYIQCLNAYEQILLLTGIMIFPIGWLRPDLYFCVSNCLW
jgi:hypothetical protein